MIDEDLHKLTDRDRARLARAVMRRQGALSLRVAAVFVVLILGVPLINAFLPELAATPVGGFTASWLFLGVLIYPVTIALSFYFVAASNRIEASCTDWRSILAEEEDR
jgi:uncharacterized membrane protein (DUF485 family)